MQRCVPCRSCQRHRQSQQQPCSTRCFDQRHRPRTCSNRAQRSPRTRRILPTNSSSSCSLISVAVGNGFNVRSSCRSVCLLCIFAFPLHLFPFLFVFLLSLFAFSSFCLFPFHFSHPKMPRNVLPHTTLCGEVLYKGVVRAIYLCRPMITPFG